MSPTKLNHEYEMASVPTSAFSTRPRQVAVSTTGPSDVILETSEGVAEPAAASEPLPILVPAAKASAELQSVLDTLTAGERNAECCICFEYLYEGVQATLTRGGANACAHFYHQHCAEQLLASNTRSGRHCPICRAPFDGAKAVPKASDDPNGWFFCVDAGSEGYLSRREVLNVLVAQFPINMERLEAHILPPAMAGECKSTRMQPFGGSAPPLAAAGGPVAA